MSCEINAIARPCLKKQGGQGEYSRRGGLQVCASKSCAELARLGPPSQGEPFLFSFTKTVFSLRKLFPLRRERYPPRGERKTNNDCLLPVEHGVFDSINPCGAHNKQLLQKIRRTRSVQIRFSPRRRRKKSFPKGVRQRGKYQIRCLPQKKRPARRIPCAERPA